jgi:hypothetical protein
MRFKFMNSLFDRLSMLLAVIAIFIGARVALNAQETAPAQAANGFRPATVSREDAEANAKRRLREGTVLTDEGGRFRQDGDGAIFVSEKQLEFVALENLNLERVARTLKGSDESESIRWSVSGAVTEFNGRNFLLISRAVYKSASPPPAPEQILN